MAGVNPYDLRYLSIFSCATTIGHALGNGLVAAVRETPLLESIIPTTAGVALAATSFTLFKTIKDKQKYDGWIMGGMSIIGSALGTGSWHLLLNLSVSSMPVMDPFINSALGYPITLGVTALCLAAFVKFEDYMNEEQLSNNPKLKAM